MFATLTSPLAIHPTVTDQVPKVELTAKRRFALAGLTEAQQSLVLEAVTVNLAYVKSKMFRKVSAERELFEDAAVIQARPRVGITRWWMTNSSRSPHRVPAC